MAAMHDEDDDDCNGRLGSRDAHHKMLRVRRADPTACTIGPFVVSATAANSRACRVALPTIWSQRILNIFAHEFPMPHSPMYHIAKSEFLVLSIHISPGPCRSSSAAF